MHTETSPSDSEKCLPWRQLLQTLKQNTGTPLCPPTGLLFLRSIWASRWCGLPSREISTPSQKIRVSVFSRKRADGELAALFVGVLLRASSRHSSDPRAAVRGGRGPGAAIGPEGLSTAAAASPAQEGSWLPAPLLRTGMAGEVAERGCGKSHFFHFPSGKGISPPSPSEIPAEVMGRESSAL